MDPLKEKFKNYALTEFQSIRAMLKEHGTVKIDEVLLSQVYGGMRGIKSMIYETSELNAQEGIKFRGYTIPELREKLPKVSGDKEPLPEGLFWLMLVNEIPTKEEVDWLSAEWARRAQLPKVTIDVIEALPIDTHPMTQFSIGIVSMNTESIFGQRYSEGMRKSSYWDATYEDSMNLIARLPLLAAYIFRRSFFNGDHIEANNDLDWAANFAHMLGIENEDFKSLMRLYLTIHADHEGGNASAHTAHLTGSTLSDPYLAFASGINSLAGPLHGLANQEVIKWIFEMCDHIGSTRPSKEQIADYVHQTLSEGKVIPGYGHAVLRLPDPRFTAQQVFAQEYIKNSDVVETVWNILDVVPPILKSLGKVKNPWPNVDAHSGAILVHYGLDQYNFYTVLFGVSRSLGILAALCWSRALGLPLERPKSLTTERIRSILKSKDIVLT